MGPPGPAGPAGPAGPPGEKGDRGLTTTLDGNAFPTGFVEGPPGPAGEFGFLSQHLFLSLFAASQTKPNQTTDTQLTRPNSSRKVRPARLDLRGSLANAARQVRRANAARKANEANG